MGQGAGMQGAASPGGSAFGGPMMGGPPVQGGVGNAYGQVPTNMAMGSQPMQPGPMMTGGGSSMAGLPPGAPMPGNPTPTQYNYGNQAGQPYNPNLQYPGAGMIANTATGAGSLNPMAVQQALQRLGAGGQLGGIPQIPGMQQSNPQMLRALGLG